MTKMSLKNLMMLMLSASLVIGAVLAGGCIGKAQIIESITPQEAFALIQENQDNPNFVIIDLRWPKLFAKEHIENAINIDYDSETFRDEFNKLDKNKTYLIYYSCSCGPIDGKAVNMMAELNFREVYLLSGGLQWWKEKGLPTAQETPTQITESITPQEAFTLVQENQDNPDFAIIDLRWPETFAYEHIENAINIDYNSETFRDKLSQLDKNKAYLIYSVSACGNGPGWNALAIMKELDFWEVYNMTGGCIGWKLEGFPTVGEGANQ